MSNILDHNCYKTYHAGYQVLFKEILYNEITNTVIVILQPKLIGRLTVTLRLQVILVHPRTKIPRGAAS